MQKTQVGYLGREGPLEKEMATHSTLENPVDRGASQRATVHRVTKKSDPTQRLNNDNCALSDSKTHFDTVRTAHSCYKKGYIK